MPRISPTFLRKAAGIDSRLPFLLPECNGSVEQALQELDWIKQELHTGKSISRACWLRYHRVPLQYILKSQPFGPLNIRTEPGVLIPRWETEEWCMDLISRLPDEDTNVKFRVLDLCAGTGCISLAIANAKPSFAVSAVDFSRKCVELIKYNKDKLRISSGTFRCQQVDILKHSENVIIEGGMVNLITCNPPYIPAHEFTTECSTSVKLYEPRAALVGDLEFYDNLLQYWIHKTDSFVYEVGELKQCMHIKNALARFENWVVGIKFDSNDKPRCVFGYNKNATSKVNYESIFRGF